jgi:glyoxylate utilization-related uncharacterized protein
MIAPARGRQELARDPLRTVQDRLGGIPGADPACRHSHRTIEEIYFVLCGEIRIKLDDALEILRQHEAVWLAPATVRAVRTEAAEDAAFAMISLRVDDFRSESRPHERFWPLQEQRGGQVLW